MIDTRLANAFRKFSFTPAQIRCATALFKGQSVNTYAQKAGISINTARWHVKQVYSKSDVHRQTQLIHKFLRDMDVITD